MQGKKENLVPITSHSSASQEKPVKIVNGESLFPSSTSLQKLVELGIISRKQLKHCSKRNLRTIGDVIHVIEKYHLTPDSTRFTKYTLDIWFNIASLSNNKVFYKSIVSEELLEIQEYKGIKKEDEEGIEHVFVDIPSAEPYIETEVSLHDANDVEFKEGMESK